MSGEYFREGFSACFDPLTRRYVNGDDLEWVNDPTILRMFNVGQLGLSREGPTDNPWTRGRHVASGSIMVRDILSDNGFPELAQALGAIEMLYHDPHPSGGDGVKNILGISEVSVAQDYFFSGESWDRFVERCKSLGWGPEVMRDEILLMISRKSHSPIAKLVHNPDKGKADVDFINYTMADLAFGAKATARMPNDRYHPRWCTSQERAHTCPVSLGLVALGTQLGSIVKGGEFGNSHKINSYTFSYADFNPVSLMRWDKNIDEWVFTDNEVLAHNVVASAVLHRFLYFHPGMQGPELRLGHEAKRLGITDELRTLAMSLDDDGLVGFLKEYDLDYWISPEAHEGWIYTHSRHWDQSKPGTYKFQLPKFNLRLDTPVMAQGKIVSFREARPDVVEFADSIIRDISGREVLLVDLMEEKRPKSSRRERTA